MQALIQLDDEFHGTIAHTTQNKMLEDMYQFTFDIVSPLILEDTQSEKAVESDAGCASSDAGRSAGAQGSILGSPRRPSRHFILGGSGTKAAQRPLSLSQIENIGLICPNERHFYMDKTTEPTYCVGSAVFFCLESITLLWSSRFPHSPGATPADLPVLSSLVRKRRPE